MPIRYEKDSNGRWKAVGVASRDELTPRQLAPGSAEGQRAAGFGRAVGAQARLRGRPVVWAGPDLGWQSPKSFEKAKAQGRLPKPAGEPVNRRTGLSWWANEAKWLIKQFGEMNAGYQPTGTLPPIASPGAMFTPVQYRDRGGRVRYSLPSTRLMSAATTVGAADNVLKSGEALTQYLRGKEVNPGQAAWSRSLTSAGYRLLGAKEPSQQSQFEQGLDSNFRSVGINAAVSAAMVPLAPMAIGTTAVGTAARGAGLFVGEQVISTALDDNTQSNASNLMEGLLAAAGVQAQVPGAVRPTDDWGEATRKSLIPNTVAAGLIGVAFGAAANSFGFTKRWLKERRVTSEVQRARVWAEERGLIAQGDQGFVNRYSPPEFVGDLSMAQQRPAAAMPDAGPQVAVEGEARPVVPTGVSLDQTPLPAPARGPVMGIEGLPGAEQGDVALQGPAPVPTSRQYPTPAGPAESQPRIIGRPDPYSPLQERLRQMDAAQNPDTAAYQQWLEANQQVRGVPTRQMEMGGPVLDGELPRVAAEAGDPWVDPGDFNPVADPSLPETDQLVRDIWDLDDASLIAAAENPGPVVPEIEQQLANQRAFDPAGDPRFQESAAELATAPGEALGFRGPEGLAAYEARLREQEWSGLRALTDPENNPRVARLIESNTGRDPSEFTREDMIEGLLEIARADDRYVIPRPNGELNRPGEVVMPVEDLGVDPSRFQFKGGIDPRTGEQLGRSLDGIDAWNTDLEGTVSVWRDPADGSTWVINGHNRVAAAQKLGVKSLPVKFYEAPDARGARAIGAAQNIATGQGTPIDAAKFMRDTGVTEVAQLRALVPGMPMKSGWADQGLALSRLPDDVFSAVAQGDLSVARGVLIGDSGKTPQEMSALWRYAEKRNVSDRLLRELVAMTAPESTATPAAARQKTIWDVLGSDSAEAQAFNDGLVKKARLVDRVRSRLAADRRLFATVAGRGAAERLQAGAANTIDAAGSRAVADQANQVLGVFDQLRYQTGPVGDLLNQGVTRLDGGEALDAVAIDVANQVADAMEQTLGGGMASGGQRAVAVPSAEMVQWAEANLLTPRKLATRQQKKAQLDAQFAAVEDLVTNPQKYEGVPDDQLPKLPRGFKAQDNPLRRELEAHAKAEQILAEVAAAEQQGAAAADAMRTAMEPQAMEPQGMAAEGPVRLSPQDREQLQVGLVQRAIDGDEVRPPSTPTPQLLEGPQVPLARALDVLDEQGLAFGNDAAQAMADELRLAAEYSYRDAAMQKAAKEAFREETGYYELDPAERIASGQFRDGFRDEPAVGTGLDERAAYARQQRQQAEAAGDGVADSAAPAVRVEIPPNAAAKLTPSNERSAAELLLSWANNGVPRGEGPVKSIDDALALVRAKGQRLNTDRVPGLDLDAALNDQAMGRVTDATRAVKAAYQQFYGVAEVMPSAGPVRPIRPEPLRLTAPASQPELLLPQDLRKSSPRYGTNTITFQSDLDRAAYVLANDAVKPSKAAAKFRAAVDAAGLDVGEVIAHGRKVKQALKDAAGGGAAPQQATEIRLPAQSWDGPMDEMSMEGWGAVDTAPFDNEKARLERQIMALKIIREVAGPEVAVRFEDQYLKKIKGAEWGGDGKATTLQGGFYSLQKDLIMVRGVLQGSETDVAEAAFHESFHRLQYLALGEKESKVLDSHWSRLKIALGSNHVTGSANTGKPIAYSESQAVAFQRYAEARRNGQDPVVAMLGGYRPETPSIEKALIQAVALFDRIADVVEKLFNRVALGTFDSTRAIFERARRGALVEQADYAFEEAGSGFERMLGRDGWRSTSWDWQKIARGGDTQAMEMDSLAVPGSGSPGAPQSPTPPRRPERPKALKASPAGLVPADMAAPLSPFGPLDLINNPVAVGPRELVLPDAVQQATPLYGKAQVQFSSPLDQAAYVLARESSGQPSRAVNQLRKALEAAGYDPADVARYGRERIQPAVREAAGAGGAPQQAGAQIQVPEQDYQGPTRLPRSEVQRLKQQMVAFDQELAAIDAELAQLTKQAALGGCN